MAPWRNAEGEIAGLMIMTPDVTDMVGALPMAEFISFISGCDGLIAGSAHYASPEQISGEPVDAASDIYSLGVTGFLALTGRLPFDAPTTREVIAMHLNTRPPPIVSLAPTVTYCEFNAVMDRSGPATLNVVK